MNPKLTKLFWRCHSACAIYTGGFLAFIMITGAFAMFAEEIYRWEHRDLYRTDARELDVSVLPEAVAQASQSLATEGREPQLIALHLPRGPGEAVRASFYNTSFKPKPFVLNQPWLMNSVFLHPETGAQLGIGQDDRSLSTYLRLVHVRIFAGTLGRNFVGLFGIALTFLCVTGLVIFFKFLGGRAMWAIRRRPARAANADWHKLIGFVLLLPTLMFAVTGFWLGMQGRLMEWFSIERPESYEREPVIDATADTAHAVDIGGILAAAQTVHPHLVPQEISWSDDGTRTVRIRGRIPGTIYERFSQGVVFDKADLSVLKVIDTPNASWKEKLFYIQEGLHFGDWGGLGLKLLYLIVGLLIGVLPLTGYAIYRLRSRQSLVPFWRWIGFGTAYIVGMIGLLKGQGIIVTASYGTIALLLFVAGLIIYWVQGGIRGALRTRSKTRQTPAPAASNA